MSSQRYCLQPLGFSRYLITTDGRIFNLRRRELKQRVSCSYKTINLVHDTKGRVTERVHNLMAMLFYPLADDKQYIVYHINHDTLDNRVSNLKWITATHQVHFPDSDTPILTSSSVIKTDRRGAIVRRYDSLSAAVMETGLDLDIIWSLCLGTKYDPNGYIWKLEFE